MMQLYLCLSMGGSCECVCCYPGVKTPMVSLICMCYAGSIIHIFVAQMKVRKE